MEATNAPSISQLSEQFLRHGTYLRDWSPQTVSTYRHAFRDCPKEITKATLNAAVVAMRERGLSAGGINVRLRSINSFLTWLHEEGRYVFQTFDGARLERHHAYRDLERLCGQ